MRPVIVKLGGSHARSPRLGPWLRAIEAVAGRVVLVPEGGPFADTLRMAQPEMGYDDEAADAMAMLAMVQFGLALCSLSARLSPAESVAEIEAARAAMRIPVWAPLAEVARIARLFRDTAASAPPVGRFYDGWYHTLILAPATSNTVAKCVAGISDTLATNVFAQAGKCRVPAIVFACDGAPEVLTEAPGGTVRVFPPPHRPRKHRTPRRLRTHPGRAVAR